MPSSRLGDPNVLANDHERDGDERGPGLDLAVDRRAVPFGTTAADLEAALTLLEWWGPSGGGAVDADLRREALARYGDLPAPGGRPGRGWRHDYDRLTFEGLRWTTGRTRIPTSPFDALRHAHTGRHAELVEARPAGGDDADARIDQPALATENAGGLVHLGPVLLEPATAAALPDGVTVTSLADARRAGAAALASSGADAAVRELVASDRFAALATAFQNCGAFVHVADGVALDAPIQLVFATSAAEDDAIVPQIVVVLGDGARATVIERYVGDGDALVCGVTTAHLGRGAQLDYAVVQQASETARVFSSRTARCAADARVHWHVAELGATLVRSVADARLEGEGAQAATSALFFNTGFQHVDLTTTTDHAVGKTASDTVVRTAAGDRGQGRFFGNIVIRAKAHGADASLRDDALLLSRRAHVDSVPALEIAANDVKAFHGATVGSLDEDALFYAGSRGIVRSDAVRMVALAFFEPAIARFPSEALRDEVRTALDHKIDAATEIGA